MRVYVAAPWTRKDEAKRYADALEAAGHTITKKWWEHREVPGYLQDTLSRAEMIELENQAAEDIRGVVDAHAFVLLNLEKSEGKAVETGAASMLTILYMRGLITFGPTTLILVGGKSNLFHYAPLWDEAATPEDVVALLT